MPSVELLRHLAVGVALGELGRRVRERGENSGPEIDAYLKNAGIHVPAPWCATFVQWCADRAARLHGLPNPLDGVAREALVLDYFTLASERGWLVTASQADAGDLVLYDFPNNARAWDHIGFLVEPPGTGGVFTAIEGNTNAEGGREGNAVALKDRRINPGRTVFARWDEGLTFAAARAA